MNTTTIRYALVIDGLGWIAINEFALLRDLLYCKGIENYKQRKTFWRSYAEGTVVFEVPTYFANRFQRIINSLQLFGLVTISDQLPKEIPTEMETRLLDMLDDKEYTKKLKREYLKSKKWVSYTGNSTMMTKYGEFPVEFLWRHVFSQIGLIERFLFWIGK